MAVSLRLTRMGRKKRPYYRIIAVDKRRKRDGAFLERIGHYHPLDNPPGVEINAEKALKWLHVGAQPSNTVRSLLRKEGIWLRFRLEKRGMPEEQINEVMAEWFVRKASSAKAVDSTIVEEEKEATPEETAEIAAETDEIEKDALDKTEEVKVDEVKAEAVEKTEDKASRKTRTKDSGAEEIEAPEEQKAADVEESDAETVEDTVEVVEVKAEAVEKTEDKASQKTSAKESSAEEIEAPEEQKAADVEESGAETVEETKEEAADDSQTEDTEKSEPESKTEPEK